MLNVHYEYCYTKKRRRGSNCGDSALFLLLVEGRRHHPAGGAVLQANLRLVVLVRGAIQALQDVACQSNLSASREFPQNLHIGSRVGLFPKIYVLPLNCPGLPGQILLVRTSEGDDCQNGDDGYNSQTDDNAPSVPDFSHL